MDTHYIEITFEVETANLGEIVIALINEIPGVEGYEEGDGYVKAFIPATGFDPSSFDQLSLPSGIKYSQSLIENKNWNAIWEQEFEPVIIDDFVAVRADFHRPVTDIKYEIIITPKMSFGTGHHATTCLMLNSFRKYDCAGKALLDFGTGTGVLAILADKMKAASVLAIDIDEWSIQNAMENIERNGAKHIRLLKADHFPRDERWDTILANINLRVIMDNMTQFYHALNQNGILIISGILQEDRKEVELLAQQNFFTTEYIQEKNNWICMAFRKN